MSRIKQAIDRIEQAAFKAGGLAVLAREAGVAPSTAQTLIKDGHSAVSKLKALEAAAEKRLSGDPQT